MQVCNDCHHPLDADDQFCSHCGTLVHRTDRTVAIATGDPGAPISPDRAGSALGSLEAVLRTDASDAGRLTLASFERLCAGEVDDALLAAESAVTMNPRLWSAHLLAGVARNQRGETEQAEAHLHDALQAEPMAVHHKAALERMLATTMPKRKTTFTPPGWVSTFSPATWAALIGVPVLLIGLLMVMSLGGRGSDLEKGRPQYGDLQPTASPVAPNGPINQPFPTPAPQAQPSYNPPAPSPSYYPPNRPSAPPPIVYEEGDTPSRTDIRPQRTGPGPLPTGQAASPRQPSMTPMMDPLPPANPNVNGIPELEARRRGSGSSQRVEDVAPWTRTPPQAPNRTGSGASVSGRAMVGSVPSPAARPNLPPPPDAVTSTARVAPPPPPPQRLPTPAPSRAVEEPAPSRSGGRELQANARRLQNQGRNAEAAQAYREAIAAYQEEIASGRNPRSAEYGIAASRAALDLLES
ncbi:MAG: hypothetical protein KY468_18000, partial [Armatimonadetes bacterium]|nr:hypothetical protein [Armatimonadota bacterium]